MSFVHQPLLGVRGTLKRLFSSKLFNQCIADSLLLLRWQNQRYGRRDAIDLIGAHLDVEGEAVEELCRPMRSFSVSGRGRQLSVSRFLPVCTFAEIAAQESVEK